MKNSESNHPEREPEKEKKRKERARRQMLFSAGYLVLGLVVLFLLQEFVLSPMLTPSSELTYSDFRQKLTDGEISKVLIGQSEILGELNNSVPDDETEIQLVGRLRLAKVLLYQNKPDEVIALLIDRDESGFSARYNEVLGDAYVATGAYAEAQAAYEAALSENPQLSTVDNNLIQLKLNDLPDVTELAATSAAIEAAIDEGEVAEEQAEEEPEEPEVQAKDPPETGTEQ